MLDDHINYPITSLCPTRSYSALSLVYMPERQYAQSDQRLLTYVISRSDVVRFCDVPLD